MPSPRTWTLEIPAPAPWITANHGLSKYPLAQRVRLWRGAAEHYARQARLPRGLARVRIDGVAHYRSRQAPVRDSGNLHPTMKAVIDGLGPERLRYMKGMPQRSPGYGLISDDSDKHLDGPYIILGDRLPPKPFGGAGVLVLTITELESNPS